MSIFSISSFWQVLRQRTIRRIKDVSFYAISIDETTSVKVESICSAYARICNKLGVPEELFLGVYQLPKGDSDTIFTALLEFLAKQTLPIEFFISLCTDGASPMRGCRSGVSTRIEEIHAGLLTFWRHSNSSSIHQSGRPSLSSSETNTQQQMLQCSLKLSLMSRFSLTVSLIHQNDSISSPKLASEISYISGNKSRSQLQQLFRVPRMLLFSKNVQPLSLILMTRHLPLHHLHLHQHQHQHQQPHQQPNQQPRPSQVLHPSEILCFDEQIACMNAFTEVRCSMNLIHASVHLRSIFLVLLVESKSRQTVRFLTSNWQNSSKPFTCAMIIFTTSTSAFWCKYLSLFSFTPPATNVDFLFFIESLFHCAIESQRPSWMLSCALPSIGSRSLMRTSRNSLSIGTTPKRGESSCTRCDVLFSFGMLFNYFLSVCFNRHYDTKEER